MALAQVVEENGVLTVTQTNEAALRDLQTVVLGIALSAPLLYLQMVTPGRSAVSVPSTHQDGFPYVFVFFFAGLALLWQLLRTVNQFWSRETFAFDKNEGIFIRNGRTVGPLSEIRHITAQVTLGSNQNPKFRLVLELPRCQTVTIVETHHLYRSGDFRLSRNVFSDPNERFAVFTPWLDCDKQRLVPFVPPEIMELQQRLSKYVMERRSSLEFDRGSKGTRR